MVIEAIARPVPAFGQSRIEHVCKLGGLTPREREVLELLTAGRSNTAIAEELGISRRTVEVHRANLMSKFGAHNAAELFRIVMVD